jgi:hypothetical protein
MHPLCDRHATRQMGAGANVFNASVAPLKGQHDIADTQPLMLKSDPRVVKLGGGR